MGSYGRISIAMNVYIENNIAYNGGAMFFAGTSKLILSPGATIFFIINHAKSKGGALFYQDSQCSMYEPECFFSIYTTNPNFNILRLNHTFLYFINNSAGYIASTLYGGQLNKCELYIRTNYSKDENSYAYVALLIFRSMSKIVQYNESDSLTNISSQADEIKFCEGDNVVNQNNSISVYPGEQFNVTVAALDQSGSPVPTTVYSENHYTGDRYRLSPSGQSIQSHSCTTISFTLYSRHEDFFVIFELYPEIPCRNLGNGLSLYISILPCPLGFELSEELQWRCYCNSKILKLTSKCYILKSAARIERTKNTFWISQASNNTLIIHESRCPLDYCKDIAENVTLNYPSAQCDFNRTGIVCGQCRKNFSLALGSLHCIPCNNNYTALILFFMMAGIALIVIIFLLRLTVSVGTLNGLFFYANIIQANHQAYFPRATMNFFTTFISWLNLDLGIESCFYDGMDIYMYSWFQFLFPFYLWFLVGCIILACRYSRSIAKRLGQNPVAVLATLFLMSYSKLLQAIIVPLSWTYLTYYRRSSETRSVVWLYDASIQFFKEPKHTALGLFAVSILTIFILPYIFLLFFGHWLQGYSNWKIFSCLNRIKPFMDAYHAPYRKNTRYWPGLILLSRLGLFLTFAINTNGSESINILAVSFISLTLLALQKRVYEHWCKDLLESTFILNLGILSLATFYLKKESNDDENQLILSSISVGITFITSIGILLFHISLVFKSSNIWRENMIPFIQKSQSLSKILGVTVIKDDTAVRNVEATVLHALPTTTEVAIDLNKPLLLEISTDAATYN